MKLNDASIRWVFPIGSITLPWWFGYPLQLLHLDEPAYYLMAIIPQYAINPYYSHYNPSRFCGGWWPMWIHWFLVLLVYGFVSKRCSVKIAIPIFFAIATVSVVVAHIILQSSGYEFELDTV